VPGILLSHPPEDVTEMAAVPMPNIRSDTLEKVILYCTYHTEHKADLEETKSKWDQEFVKVEQGPLFEMILAANYLDIKPMLDLTCRTVAEMIKGILFNICRVSSSQEKLPMRFASCLMYQIALLRRKKSRFSRKIRGWRRNEFFML